MDYLRIFVALLDDHGVAVQAVATAALAIITWTYVKRTSDIARATRESAEQQARLARLMEKDLTFRIRPYLRFKPLGGEARNPLVSIVNDGPGIAAEIKLFARYFPKKREDEIAVENYLPSGRTAKFGLRLLDDEGDYEIEIVCTDSAKLNVYLFLWGSDEKLKDFRATPRLTAAAPED